MSFYISDGNYIRFKYGEKQMVVMFREDMEPINPREWSDGLGKMVCWHGRYRLGDRHDYRDPEDFLRGLTREIIPWELIAGKIINGETQMKVVRDDDPENETPFSLVVPYILPWKGEYEICKAKTVDELFSQFNRDAILEDLTTTELHGLLQESDNIVLLPLWLYDHSGISMSTSHTYPYTDRWDSGQVGWIYLTKDRFLEETSYKESQWPEKAKEMLVGEVKTYDQYLRGEVFGFQVFVFDDETKEWEETNESCWGFYGDDLMENGILDNVDGLKEAIESEQYETGQAREVTTITYEFD